MWPNWPRSSQSLWFAGFEETAGRAVAYVGPEIGRKRGEGRWQ